MNKKIIPRYNKPNLTIDSEVSTSKGIYSIESDHIGKGGNGIVYKCSDLISGDDYAIKFLLSEGNKISERFDREITFLKMHQSHNHIIQYIDSGTVKAFDKKGKEYCLPFYIMELADGGNLGVLIRDSVKIEYKEYIGQFRGLTDALQFIHNKNIIHRDIKPDNILIKGERWILSDFGLISDITQCNDLTSATEKVGPRFWMSPEAINKSLGHTGTISSISKHSDVFQLASVFWYVVNKRHPSGILCKEDWQGDNNLFSVLGVALQHDSTKRYEDGHSFHKALVDAIEG